MKKVFKENFTLLQPPMMFPHSQILEGSLYELLKRFLLFFELGMHLLKEKLSEPFSEIYLFLIILYQYNK